MKPRFWTLPMINVALGLILLGGASEPAAGQGQSFVFHITFAYQNIEVKRITCCRRLAAPPVP
jgi:hypothetical protein